MNTLNIITLVLYIATSIAGIVTNLRVGRVQNNLTQIENRLTHVENKLTQVVTQGANSSVYNADEIKITYIFSPTVTVGNPPNVKFAQPSTITPPSDTSP
jgi:hypothetical protein